MSLSREQFVEFERALREAATRSAKEAKDLLAAQSTRLSHEQLVQLERTFAAAAAASSHEAKALLETHLALHSSRVTPLQVLSAARAGHMEFIVRLAERADGTSAELIRLADELSEFDAADAQLAIGRRVFASPDCTRAFASACLVMLTSGALTGRDVRPEIRAGLDALALAPLTETVEALAMHMSEPRGDCLALDPFRALLAARIVDVANRNPRNSPHSRPGDSGSSESVAQRLQDALGNVGVSDFLEHVPAAQASPAWRLDDAHVRGVDRLYSALVVLKGGQHISADPTVVGHLEVALSTLEQCGRSRGAAWARHMLARCLTEGDAASDDFKRAVVNWDRAADLLESVADFAGAADMSERAGHVLIGEHTQPKAWGDARRRFARSAALYAKAGDTGSEGNAHYWEGWCVEPMNNPEGDWRAAIDFYGRAARCGASANDHERESRARHALGWSTQPDHNPGGDWAAAAGHYEAALQLRKGGDDALAYAKTAHRLAVCLCEGKRAGVTARAHMLFSEAAAIREREAPDTAAESWDWIGGRDAGSSALHVTSEDSQDIDADGVLDRIQSLCHEKPERGLALIDALTKQNPEVALISRVRWARALAHRTLGVAHLGDCLVGFPNADEYAGRFTDEQVGHIDEAIGLVGAILRDEPDFLSTAFPDNDGWETVDVWATFLEVCRPGRVQELLGFTKLRYWGLSRHGMSGHVKGVLDPQLFASKFSRVAFKPRGNARSAFFYAVGRMRDGRRYLCFMPVAGLLSSLRSGEVSTLGELDVLEPVAVVEDGASFNASTTEDLERKLGHTGPIGKRQGGSPPKSSWFRRLLGR